MKSFFINLFSAMLALPCKVYERAKMNSHGLTKCMLEFKMKSHGLAVEQGHDFDDGDVPRR